MKIANLKFPGLVGATVEGGWAEERKPSDDVRTIGQVITEDGLEGVGSAFTSSALVKAAGKLLALFLAGERADEPARVS